MLDRQSTACSDSGDAVQTRRLKGELSVTLYAFYRLDDRLNPVQRRFLTHVRQRAKRMLSSG